MLILNVLNVKFESPNKPYIDSGFSFYMINPSLIKEIIFENVEVESKVSGEVLDCLKLSIKLVKQYDAPKEEIIIKYILASDFSLYIASVFNLSLHNFLESLSLGSSIDSDNFKIEFPQEDQED